MTTKKKLRNELYEAKGDRILLEDENARLRKENEGLRRANLALGAEINYLNDKIDRAVQLLEAKKRARKGVPAWLKEVFAE